MSELRSTPGSLTAFTSVCQGLVVEQVPLKPLDEIWRCYADSSGEDVNLQNIVEQIRSLPAVRSQLPGNVSTYSILRLGPTFETAIKDAIYESGGHCVLALEPQPCQTLLSSVRNSVVTDESQLAVVEDAELRPFVRSLIELEFPRIPVMSRKELASAEFYERAPAVEMTDPIPAQTPNFRRPDESVSVPARLEKTSADQPGISVVVHQSLISQPSAADDQQLVEILTLMQDGLFEELGIILPDIRIEVERTMSPEDFRFRINGSDLPVEKGLQQNEILVNEAATRLKFFGIEGREAVNPANGNQSTIVVNEASVNATCKEAGLTTWGPAGFIVLKLSSVIRKQASSFQNMQSTQFSLDALRVLFPELVAGALNRFSVEQIRQVLTNLLDEEISIKDLRGILESMLSVNGVIDVDEDRFINFIPPAENLCSPATDVTTIANLSAGDYSAFVRTEMKRYISHKYTRGQSTLSVYLVDRELEARFSRLGQEPFTAEEIVELKSSIRSEVGAAQNPVILTTFGVRPVLKKLIENDLPNIAVLAYQELSPELNIQAIARISWERSIPA
jgi:type III secretory pathway component EscV